MVRLVNGRKRAVSLVVPVSLTHSLTSLSVCFFTTVVQLQKQHTSEALVIASVWTSIVHALLAILGTFVLKRFPTSFSIGFLMGILVVLAQQNLILFATFQSYGLGNITTNRIFASAAFTLFVLLSFFSLLLFQFKKEVSVSPLGAASKQQQQQASAQHHHNQGGQLA